MPGKSKKRKHSQDGMEHYSRIWSTFYFTFLHTCFKLLDYFLNKFVLAEQIAAIQYQQYENAIQQQQQQEQQYANQLAYQVT